MLNHLNERSHVPIVDGARVASNSSDVAPPRSAVSSIGCPPTRIDPITVNPFVPLFAQYRGNSTRRSTSPARPARWASSAAGNWPADGTRFGSSKVADTRRKS